MNLPPVWFDLPRGLADSAAAVPDVTVICTTGGRRGAARPASDRSGRPIAREYNEQLAEAQAKYPGRFYSTADIPLNDTK
jgi:aminocarboxymuconate-semialdehyde decarboxylase